MGERTLLELADHLRRSSADATTRERRSELGQFLTPAAVAQLLASMCVLDCEDVSILDPGAGAGALFAAVVTRILQRPQRPRRIRVQAHELDDGMIGPLRVMLRACAAACDKVGVAFEGAVVPGDFLEAAVQDFGDGWFSRSPSGSFQCAILNPPYKKIAAHSPERIRLARLGIETSNLYAGFVAAAMKYLVPNGEMVAITPRSFCNGPYFGPFRRLYLETMSLRRIHLFESRHRAFREDEVLQENVITYAVKRPADQTPVVITVSDGSPGELLTERSVPYREVVRTEDANRVLHVTADEHGQEVVDLIRQNSRSRLEELGLRVSTGPVVDFRLRTFLRRERVAGSVPLLYPSHFRKGFIEWPRSGRKPNAIAADDGAVQWLSPKTVYVLVKRFTSKEEKKRLVAAVLNPQSLPGQLVGIENHLNYFHGDLDLQTGKGLAAYLNSTLADEYFRQFSGHTQVNATDLRALCYPDRSQLKRIGARIADEFPPQAKLDDLVESEVISERRSGRPRPSRVKRRTQEAQELLRELGMPPGLLNERSALSLLALVNLPADQSWDTASDPLRGITPLMEFMSREYGKTYAANTRETIRKSVVQCFLQEGLVIENPDQPARPVNSPNWVYQISADALAAIREYGKPGWAEAAANFRQKMGTRNIRERVAPKQDFAMRPGQPLQLSPGGQNELIESIWQLFVPHFLPKGRVLYIGDAKEKWRYADRAALEELGLQLELRGKMPDMVVHDPSRQWLVLVEAVTSHGPINAKRHRELQALFQNATAGLVFVTAFRDRKAMRSFLADIVWETEVWVADEPEHLIHFNGERFLGPYR